MYISLNKCTLNVWHQGDRNQLCCEWASWRAYYKVVGLLVMRLFASYPRKLKKLPCNPYRSGIQRYDKSGNGGSQWQRSPAWQSGWYSKTLPSVSPSDSTGLYGGNVCLKATTHKSRANCSQSMKAEKGNEAKLIQLPFFNVVGGKVWPLEPCPTSWSRKRTTLLTMHN